MKGGYIWTAFKSMDFHLYGQRSFQCVAMVHGKLQVSQTISFGCRHSPVNGREVIMFSLQCLNMVVPCDDSLFQMENVQCQHYTNIISTILEEQLASA